MCYIYCSLWHMSSVTICLSDMWVEQQVNIQYMTVFVSKLFWIPGAKEKKKKKIYWCIFSGTKRKKKWTVGIERKKEHAVLCVCLRFTSANNMVKILNDYICWKMSVAI